MVRQFPALAILLLTTTTIHACNYRKVNISGHPNIFPMGCDAVTGGFRSITCYNTTAVMITTYRVAPCIAGSENGTQTLASAASFDANCSTYTDCQVTTIQDRVTANCSTVTGLVNEYAGDMCVQTFSITGSLRSVIQTCDKPNGGGYAKKYEFASANCDPGTLAYEHRIRKNVCMPQIVPVNASSNTLRSQQISCSNPQGKIIPTNASNPQYLEYEYFGNDRCQGQPNEYRLEFAAAYRDGIQCIPHPLLNVSSQDTCDGMYDFENTYEGTNCDGRLLFRMGTTLQRSCIGGVRKKCIQSFGKNFSHNFVRIENFLDSMCTLSVINVSMVDEYLMNTCIYGSWSYQCNADGTRTLTRSSCDGSNSFTYSNIDAGCIPNPDPDPVVKELIPYVRVYTRAGCLPPLRPSTGGDGKQDNSSAVGLAIGISLGVIILLGVGCIFYRRAKLRQEQETLSLLTNETEK